MIDRRMRCRLGPTHHPPYRSATHHIDRPPTISIGHHIKDDALPFGTTHPTLAYYLPISRFMRWISSLASHLANCSSKGSIGLGIYPLLQAEVADVVDVADVAV
jgi:hypothetical protein